MMQQRANQASLEQQTGISERKDLTSLSNMLSLYMMSYALCPPPSQPVCFPAPTTTPGNHFFSGRRESKEILSSITSVVSQPRALSETCSKQNILSGLRGVKRQFKRDLRWHDANDRGPHHQDGGEEARIHCRTYTHRL